MKKYIVIIALLVLGVSSYFIFTNSETRDESLSTYTNETLGYSFQYKTGPDGYILEEFEGSRDSYENLTEALVLIQNADYQSIINGERDGGEGPPTINVFVFSNPRNLSPQSWVESYPQISNFPLKTSDYTNTTISEQSGIMYEADGLYASKNVVFAHDNSIYFLSGSYLDRSSMIYDDFSNLLSSFSVN